MNLLDLPPEMIFKILWKPSSPKVTLSTRLISKRTSQLFTKHQQLLLHHLQKTLNEESPWEFACKKGYLDVVKFLHKNRKEGCTTIAMDQAALQGHLDVVKFLHKNRKEGCTINAMSWAANSGHLDVVKFLHENRKEGCSTWAMDWAAGQGHIEVVQWLHENRKEGYTIRAMFWAAFNGHLEMVKWLCVPESIGLVAFLIVLITLGVGIINVYF